MANGKYSGKRVSSAPKEVEKPEPMAGERAEIIAWLKKVHFRRRIFGGVDERSVWRKISELDALYLKALEAERVRCNVLIEEAKRAAQRGSQESPDLWPDEGGDRLG